MVDGQQIGRADLRIMDTADRDAMAFEPLSGPELSLWKPVIRDLWRLPTPSTPGDGLFLVMDRGMGRHMPFGPIRPAPVQAMLERFGWR